MQQIIIFIKICQHRFLERFKHEHDKVYPVKNVFYHRTLEYLKYIGCITQFYWYVIHFKIPRLKYCTMYMPHIKMLIAYCMFVQQIWYQMSCSCMQYCTTVHVRDLRSSLCSYVMWYFPLTQSPSSLGMVTQIVRSWCHNVPAPGSTSIGLTEAWTSPGCSRLCECTSVPG